MAQKKWIFRNSQHDVNLIPAGTSSWQVMLDNEPVTAQAEYPEPGRISLVIRDKRHSLQVVEAGGKTFVSLNGRQFILESGGKDAAGFRRGETDSGDVGNDIGAPMPGKLLKLFVAAGDVIEKGDPLFIVEAMKMENEVKAPRAGIVAGVRFPEGALLAAGEAVVELQPE